MTMSTCRRSHFCVVDVAAAAAAATAAAAAGIAAGV